MKKKYQGSIRAKKQQLQALRSEFEVWRVSYRLFFTSDGNSQQDDDPDDKSEDVTIFEKILRTMTPKFNFVVCSIEESHDIDMLSIDELQSSLLIHEQKINQQEKEELALKASIENHLTSDNRTGGRGSGRGNGRGRGRGKGRGRDNNNYGNQQQGQHQKINAKEEEEDKVATTQSHQTSPKLNVIDATGEKSDLIGFTNSDYAGDLNDRKSTSGYVFMMGSEAISWSLRKQSIVTLSSTEAEFIAATACAGQAI
ncbi:hypothetical protein GH714_008665 [Hevea brasiliensis]|uniref:Reverse transcriptase Ty1/copia-type domain-containing protein n=1 Tax=Hevea brasiliensis TaxID=3981 RepID=A0A6A6LZD2_HEVBR|nr:hypothetical protein GH714_008665 [Hevea brasiliensis]